MNKRVFYRLGLKFRQFISKTVVVEIEFRKLLRVAWVDVYTMIA